MHLVVQFPLGAAARRVDLLTIVVGRRHLERRARRRLHHQQRTIGIAFDEIVVNDP